MFGTEAGYTVMDRVGDFQADPGSGWTVCGVADATKDHDCAQETVRQGNPDWTRAARWTRASGTST